MLANEFAEFAMTLSKTYPKYEMFKDDFSKTLWFDMLKDLDYPSCKLFFFEWVANEKFPPTIADIRKAVINMHSTPVKSWEEAWGEITRAVRKYGYMRPNQALESMSEETAKVAEYIGWQAICESENPETLRAQFRQMYENVQKRSSAERVIPESVKQAIEGMRLVNIPENKTEKIGDGNGRVNNI